MAGMSTAVRGAVFGLLSEPDISLGGKLAVALDEGTSWKHRKVESLRLLEGEFGRRRVSLDLTPPKDLDLADIGYEPQAILVPLGMITKGPMRDFDISDGVGAPVPILGHSDDGFAAWSMLVARFRAEIGQEIHQDVVAALYEIVHGPAAQAREIAVRLGGGRVGDTQYFAGDRLLVQTVLLLEDLADNFLLVALLPRASAGVRQVVKYSSHWHVTDPSERVGPLLRLKIGLGIVAAPYDLRVNGSSDAQSYHLEVHALPGMLTAGLQLPSGSDSDAYTTDESVDVVAHAVGSYSESPTGSAQVILAVPRGGLRNVALFTTLFTSVTFWLDRLLPNGHTALLQSEDGAAALLLIVPAAYSVVLARPNENALLSYLLWPLRVITFFCIALLLCGAASLVGHLHKGWSDGLWWFGAIASLALLVLQIHARRVSQSV
jgi:hypothetical protein